jgi:hypothetical protein
MEASNLLVEAFLVASVLAHQHGEDRLARLASDALCGRPIGVPNRLLLARLREDESNAARQADDEQS